AVDLDPHHENDRRAGFLNHHARDGLARALVEDVLAIPRSFVTERTRPTSPRGFSTASSVTRRVVATFSLLTSSSTRACNTSVILPRRHSRSQAGAALVCALVDCAASAAGERISNSARTLF